MGYVNINIKAGVTRYLFRDDLFVYRILLQFFSTIDIINRRNIFKMAFAKENWVESLMTCQVSGTFYVSFFSRILHSKSTKSLQMIFTNIELNRNIFIDYWQQGAVYFTVLYFCCADA